MKILIIAPFRIYPTYSGYATRVYNLTKQLSNSHSVFLFYIDYYKKYSIPDDSDFFPEIEKFSFKVSTKFMQFLNPYLILKGISTIRKKKIDLIIAEGIWAGLHAMILHSLTGVDYYFNEQNAEYLRWKRMGKKYENILKIYEKCCCKFAKKVFCVSEIDQKFIHELGVGLKKIVVIPNGYDPTIFYPKNKNKKAIRKKINVNDETPLILFSGDFKYKPNLQAVSIIYDVLINKILDKIPNSKLLIVGSHPPLQYKHRGIIFTGFVDKIEDYINASDVVIAPLISGGGTKLKIIEAVACGKSVVTTTVGAEGLTGEKISFFLKVVDDWDKFVEEIVKILENKEMFTSPNELIQEYSWDLIGNKLSSEISTSVY